MKRNIGTVCERFPIWHLCAPGLLFLVAGCAGFGGEPKPVYVPPNLPTDQLAYVFIEDDKDSFIFLDRDAIANIEAVDGLVVEEKEVLIAPGRHSLDIEVRYPGRGPGLIDIIAGIVLAIADKDEDEDEDEDEEEDEPEPPSRYDEEVVIDARAGRRYQIKYQEEEFFGTYELDVWIDDVTYKSRQ